MNVVSDTIQALTMVVEKLPVGTNLALLRFYWMLVSGELLASRGALFPARQAMGLEEAEVRRTWAAFRYGAWDIEPMLQTWREHVESEGHWQGHQYEGY